LKHLFYFLLFVNLVFFVWLAGFNPVELFKSQGDVEQVLELPEDPEAPVSSIEPAQEAEVGEEKIQEPLLESQPVSETLPLTQSSNGCYEMGPMVGKEQAEALLPLVQSTAKESRMVLKSGSIPDGWWVLFPRAPSLEAARHNRKLLEKKGVLDSWIFEQGPHKFGISVGLFSGRQEAQKAREGFLEKGIPTDVVPRRVRGDAYWIEIPWEGKAEDLEESVQVLKTQDLGLDLPPLMVCRQ
jgi:hypothetical protein